METILIGNSRGMNDYIAGREKILLSDLYSKMISDDLTTEEMFLVAHILKTIAIHKEAHIPFISWTEKVYVDLNEKEKREKF